MYKQPLPRTELRQAILKCLIVSSTSLTLAMGASPLMAANTDAIFTTPPTTACDYAYAVNDAKIADSQILKIDPRNGYQIEQLGPTHYGYDIEALDVSATGEIYGAAGDQGVKPGYLYKIDPVNGDITEVGPTGFAEVDGLSFNPADGKLWGWAQNAGLFKIEDLSSGKGTLVIPRDGEMEDLTWNNDGSILYVVENMHGQSNQAEPYTEGMATLPEPGGDNQVPHELFAYDVVNGFSEICHGVISSLGEIEALEIAEDGSLMLGYHNSNHKPILATVNLATCAITTLASPTDPHYLVDPQTPFDDIEGVGVCAPCPNPPSTAWMYARDSFKDETGYPALEIYGVAMKQEGDNLIVAINAGMQVTGWDVPANLIGPHKVVDGNISLSDFVFDFNGKKYAVRFAPNNNSALPKGEVGLYAQPELMDVTKQNYGHTRLSDYLTVIGDAANMADITFPTNYFAMEGFRDLPMSIESATRVNGDHYQALTEAQLQAKGLDFQGGLKVNSKKEHLGAYTYGFEFTKPADMSGRFVGYVFTECSNDGIAIVGQLPSCK